MFDRVIGHTNQKNIILNMIKNNSLSHAYLFTGNSGIGKCFFAKELAKILLETDNLDTCLDYKYISKDIDKKDLSVEKIRKELIENIYIAPAMSSKKVYIIDDGESLNTSSQNALLKTLEEPPQNVHIIIISNTSSVFLPTILSRVTEVKFSGISKEELKDYINKMHSTKLDDNLLDFLQGSIGKSNDIIENKKLEKFMNVQKIYSYIINKDVINALKLASEDDIFLIDQMLKYLEFLFLRENKYMLIEFVEKANIRLKNNGNYDIVIDNMIINIIENI